MDSNWKILFTGDIFISQELNSSFISSELGKIISEHDFASCNFEAPIYNELAKPIRKAFSPAIYQHINAARHVQEAGFNIINLASNHSYDYGQIGMAATLKAFCNQLTVGAGLDFNSAYQLQIKEIKGVKVGFLSFCESEFGALTDETLNRGGYAWINHHSVNRRIIEAKSRVNVLLIQVHAGPEEVELPLPEWRYRYKELIDLGADAVIAHHPHVPQGWEVHREKPIFYSLGNFFFTAPNKHPLWNYGYAVSLSFNGAELEEFEIIATQRDSLQVIVCKDEKYEQYLQKLSTMLDSEIYPELVNKQTVNLWNNHYNYLHMQTVNTFPRHGKFKKVWNLIGRLLTKLKIIDNLALLHNIRTESHRWSIQRALSLLEEGEVYKEEKHSKEFTNTKY
ncbi:MAG: poly-gamma-glutamate biosynthesis protein [uncultured bacterium]|nr:MAG: poly-gamma-glutamate biosynthesis protein [uncultured bacterium]HBH17653.1 hypothetical protein [Cyanobacteria bacterium UBA9579]